GNLQSDLDTVRARGPLRQVTANADGVQKHEILKNESFANLGNIGLFASRPASRDRSRSNSSGLPIRALSGMQEIHGQATLDEVSKKIASEMKERRRRRASEGEKDWEEEPVEAASEEEVEGKKDL